MGYGNNKLDVSHALSSDLLFCHLNTAVVTNDTFVTDALVFAAMTFVVLYGTENLLAEKSVSLRLVGAVVDGFGFQNLTARPFFYLLGRCKADSDF